MEFSLMVLSVAMELKFLRMEILIKDNTKMINLKEKVQSILDVGFYQWYNGSSYEG